MKNNKVHFQEDCRDLVIVEEAADIAQAEALADAFLSDVNTMDESGAKHQRIKVSGTCREGKYYFDVVVTG